MSLTLLQKANISIGIGLAEGLGSLYLAETAIEQENVIDKATIGIAAGGLAMMSFSMTWIGCSMLRENYKNKSPTSN
jgi:hypothetical protein